MRNRSRFRESKERVRRVSRAGPKGVRRGSRESGEDPERIRRWSKKSQDRLQR